MKFNVSALGLMFVLFPSTVALAHKGRHHGHEETLVDIPPKKEEKAAVKIIAETYARNIQPIFRKKCMDCHSSQTQYPWYHRIPGIKQMIDSDIQQGREHLDFTPGFPFKSHASPSEDLTAIRDSIRENSMPPFSYRLLHPGNVLTQDEKKTIVDWAEQSKKTLEK